MEGTIHSMNPRRGMVAVETVENFSIFELLQDDQFEIGDKVVWTKTRPMGHGEITNLTRKKTTTVYFQNHWVTPQQLSKQLLIQ